MGEPLSIVYVEDDPDIRALVQIIFERVPEMRLVTFEPVHDVIEAIRAAQPDLVLLDVMMPVLDGRMIAARLRDDVQLRTVPFIFMTAKAHPQELCELQSLGALGIISKPFDVLNLPKQVLSLLAKHRAG